MHQSNRNKRRFRKESSKEETEHIPEGDIRYISTLVPALRCSEHFNPADQRRSAASTNQAEIGRKT